MLKICAFHMFKFDLNKKNKKMVSQMKDHYSN